MNSEQRQQARITFLEDKIAFAYRYCAERGINPGNPQTGELAKMWDELDFLYLTEGVAA